MESDNQKKIINTLLLNASFINNIGLMHGKMGISIFFFHLAGKTSNQIYKEYAGELIDEIYEEISLDTPLDFENGLAGIGWGIEYLVQNGFLEADTNEVLEEFDGLLFQNFMHNKLEEIGVLKGVLGYGFYLLKRLQNVQRHDGNLTDLTNKKNIVHLLDDLEQRLTTEFVINLLIGKEKLRSEQQCSASSMFDITWDYPLLIWFLAETWELNVFNWKVEKLINQLLIPLIEGIWWPERLNRKLLVYLSLEKLQSSTNGCFMQLSGLVKRLKMENAHLSKDSLMKELMQNDVTLKHGLSGLALVYQRLFDMTKNEAYLQEADYWKSSGVRLKEAESALMGFPFPEDNQKLGLLEGMAGYGLLGSKDFDRVYKKTRV